MAKKHVAVCDFCGKEEPLQGGGSEHLWESDLPELWFVVARTPKLYSGVTLGEQPVLCSWKCIAEYAAREPTTRA